MEFEREIKYRVWKNNVPFYYKIISMEFCNITISHSSTPYGILGEMFKLKLEMTTPILSPYQPHSSRRYFCQTLCLT